MPFHRIPPEICEAILQHLDLHEIKNLRLANKAIASRCLGSRFLGHSSAPETDLTEQSLWNLVTRASHPTFRHAVRRLTIQAICYDHRRRHIISQWDSWSLSMTDNNKTIPSRLREVLTAQSDLKWLAKQQQIRDALSDQFIIETLATALDLFSALDEIRLETWIVAESGRKREGPKYFSQQLTLPWESHVCYLALAALVRSKSQVRVMDIFQGFKEPFRGACSGVPAKDLTIYLAKITENGHNNISLPLEGLDLNCTTGTGRKPIDNQGSTRKAGSFFKTLLFKSVDVPNEPNEISDLSGVMRLLQCMPNLRSLGLYFDYECIPFFDHEHRAVLEEYRQIFTSIASTLHLPQLQSCKLTSLSVTVNSLLQFLDKHRNMTWLVMEGLFLHYTENWSTVFRFISNNMRNLQELRLSKLYQGGYRLPLQYDSEAYLRRYYPNYPFHDGYYLCLVPFESYAEWPDFTLQFWPLSRNTET